MTGALPGSESIGVLGFCALLLLLVGMPMASRHPPQGDLTQVPRRHLYLYSSFLQWIIAGVVLFVRWFEGIPRGNLFELGIPPLRFAFWSAGIVGATLAVMIPILLYTLRKPKLSIVYFSFFHKIPLSKAILPLITLICTDTTTILAASLVAREWLLV